MEADLIRQARDGDETAYAQLVDRYREAVFRLAYLMLTDRHEAEDVAQDTFIRAFYRLHQFDDTRGTSIRSWLLAIAVNLAKNRQRSAGRYVKVIQRFAGHDPERTYHVSAEAVTTQQQDALTLWQAVQQLRASEQEVIYCRFFLDLTVAETAGALNLREGTVKSRLHRALNRLRGVIQRDFPEIDRRIE